MKTRVFVFLFMFVFLQCAVAQLYTANIENFGVEQGLSHHDATDVAIDSRGLVWVATRNGLNRFDGKKFKSFFKSDGLKYNKIDLLFTDGETVICVHKSQTLQQVNDISIFNTKTESIVGFSDWFGSSEISSADIQDVDHYNGFTFLRARKSGETLWFTKRNSENAVRITNPVPFDIIGVGKDGAYWLFEYENNRIVKRSVSGQLEERYSTRFLTKTKGKFQIDIRFHEHEKWVYGYDSLYLLKKGKVLPIQPDSDKARKTDDLVEFPSKFVWKHENSGLLWFTINSSSYLIDSNCNIYFEHTLKGQYVNNKDKFINNVVLQPTSNGLNIISLYPSKFQNFTKDFKGGYRGIESIGNGYLVCNETGIFILNENFDKEIERVALVGSNAYNLNGTVYTLGRSLVHFVDADYDVKDAYYLHEAHDVWGMYMKDSFIYYSTYGLHRHNVYSRKTEFIESKKYSELNQATVYDIQPKSNIELWLSTTAGLYSWNKQTEQFNREIEEVNGSKEFQHLCQKDSVLWLASGSIGLVKYNINSKYSKVYGFSNTETNKVHAVYPDSKNQLWLSTDNGIVCFDIESESYRIFKENDGLVNNEFNRISHFKDEKGNILFGGIKGLIRFNPDSLSNEEEFRPIIDPFVVDAWLYKKGENQVSQVTDEFINNNSININPRDRFLSFDLATNSVQYYDKVEFSYKMDGELNWNLLPSNRLEFNVLPFGKHELEVKAKLSDGYTSNNNLKFSIYVEKPVYLQMWFIALAVFSLLASAVIAVIVRTKRLERQKALLEGEVLNRTKKIVEDKEVIEKQAQELKSLDKMKNRFFANISHELRNPLTLILGPVENLLNQDQVKVPSLVKSQMNLTLKNAKNLQKRINEILALSKIDAGRLTLSLAAVNAESFFKRAVMSFESLALSKEVKIEFTSRIGAKLNLNLDTDNTEKVINNLISNAIKHSPKNTTIDIELCEIGKDLFSFTVADKGSGIEKNEQHKIFDRYYQSKKGEMAGGTGLGLSLSLELARLMNGNIIVESIEGNGAKFLFTFKAIQALDVVISDIKNLDKHNEIEKPIEINKIDYKSNVLVVDDNDEMRAYIKSILGKDCKVFEAENGKEALKLIENKKVDLITTDLMMPVMDGMEFLCRHKESTSKNVPIIMVTARADSDDKLQALEIGVDDYITKPFFARELMARVNNLLQNQKLRQEALVDDANGSTEASEMDVQMHNVIEVIKENLQNNAFTVIDLAETVGYSERQLRRIIKKEKGVSPTALIKELRLHQARSFFEKERFATISEVMFACGFKSSGHFARSYFERFGKKPIEYFE